MSMSKTKTLTKDKLLTTPARRILFDCFLRGLSIKEAANEANLSYQYARRLATKGNIKALALRHIEAKTEDLREKAEKSLLEIAESPTAKPTTKLKAWDILGKMNGWHSQTMNLESQGRQRILDSKEKEEARRFAALRFSMLPEPTVVDGTVVDRDITPRSDSNVTTSSNTDNTQNNDSITSSEDSDVTTDNNIESPCSDIDDADSIDKDPLPPNADDGVAYPSMQ